MLARASDAAPRVSADKGKQRKRKRSSSSCNEVRVLVERVPKVTADFNVLNKIGEGTFSMVYRAEVKAHPGNYVALKRIYPSSNPDRVLNEVVCLSKLRGIENIVEILAIVVDGEEVVLVMPYIAHDRFKEYFVDLTLPEIRAYLHGLFSALDAVHAAGIIHRDVKPSNFLYSRASRKHVLVDFGLAQNTEKKEDDATEALQRTLSSHSVKSEPPLKRRRMGTLGYEGYDARDRRKRAHASRAGTRGFRAPEVLLHCADQTDAIDVWSAGVIMLSIFSGRYPFFESQDDATALAELIALFGSDPMKAAAQRMGKELLCRPEMPSNSLRDVCQSLRSARVADKNKSRGSGPAPLALPNEAYDLLERCLTLDPAERISAADALNHPFFSQDYEGTAPVADIAQQGSRDDA